MVSLPFFPRTPKPGIQASLNPEVSTVANKQLLLQPQGTGYETRKAPSVSKYTGFLFPPFSHVPAAHRHFSSEEGEPPSPVRRAVPNVRREPLSFLAAHISAPDADALSTQRREVNKARDIRLQDRKGDIQATGKCS